MFYGSAKRKNSGLLVANQQRRGNLLKAGVGVGAIAIDGVIYKINKKQYK